MNNIHEILDELAHTNEKCVLATIIHVEGSAYRKEGATMLFTENNRQIGMISAGCLEADLAIQARILLKDETKYSHTVVYDMRSEDDLSWGRGAGCSGTIHILLEKVHKKLKEQLQLIREHLHNNVPVFLYKFLKENHSEIRTTFIPGNKQYIKKDKMNAIGNKKEQLLHYTLDNKNGKIFIQVLHPKPRLFIFGAGSDVKPLSQLAINTNFDVSIWDWRPAYLNKIHFPSAKLMQQVPVAKFFEHTQFITTDSVVVMTHDFQKDKEILRYLLECEQIGYIGVLGPRERTSRLLNNSDIPTHLHSPVGLPIHADGPEEIAVSILAELIQILRKQRSTIKQEDLPLSTEQKDQQA